MWLLATSIIILLLHTGHVVAGSFLGFCFMFLQKGLQQSCDLYRHKVVDDYDVLNIAWMSDQL